MYAKEDLIQLSALQHFAFCPRQCALIHIEQAWSENIFTAEGRIMHEKAHEEKSETRSGVRIERGMAIRSLELGLIGKADVVEFHRQTDSATWLPFPVEYKRGNPKPDDCDKVQLCAQTLCLEEMLGVNIQKGAIFYGKTRRRLDVGFDAMLRQETKELAAQLHEFLNAGKTPPPVFGPQCKSCSLVGICLPKPAGTKMPVNDYLREASLPG